MLPYAIEHIEGKGRSMVAIRDIAAGECILEEKPLFRLSSGLLIWPLCAALLAFCSCAALASKLLDGIAWMSWLIFAVLIYAAVFKISLIIVIHDCVRRMSTEKRKSFFDLHCGRKSVLDMYQTTLTIFRRNSLGTDSGMGAMYATICLINHSCSPNAYHCWHADTRKGFVHAMRPIRNGDEIVHSYIDTLQTSPMRQEALSKNHTFKCACIACSAPEAARRVSDSRRALCSQLRAGIPSKADHGQKEEALQDAHALLDLLDTEFGDAHHSKSSACWSAYQIAMNMDHAGVAKQWAAKAYRFGLQVEGATHPNVIASKAAMW